MTDTMMEGLPITDKQKQSLAHFLTNGAISSITEWELLSIPQYLCKCGNLFRTSTARRTCDICIREKSKGIKK